MTSLISEGLVLFLSDRKSKVILLYAVHLYIHIIYSTFTALAIAMQFRFVAYIAIFIYY